MDDLISRQAAIDAVCESCGLEGDYHKCDGYQVGSTWCEEITALRNVPSAPQWIPCSKQLPKYDDWEIVTILDESGDTPSKYTDFGWYLETASCWVVAAEQRTDVIAWMPLPEPYKGVTE